MRTWGVAEHENSGEGGGDDDSDGGGGGEVRLRWHSSPADAPQLPPSLWPPPAVAAARMRLEHASRIVHHGV